MATTKAKPATDRDDVFAALRAILAPYAAALDVKRDAPGDLYVDTRHTMPNGQPLFFGAVSKRKDYVSYYLMPVYVTPALLDGVSPELRARMQGKSCFNFRRVDPALFAELGDLTRASFDSYAAQGWV